MRALELRRSKICFPEFRPDQHRAFKMARAKRDGFRKRLDLCLGIEFGVVDHVKARKNEAVRPKAFWLAGGKIDLAGNQEFMWGKPASPFVRPRDES